MSTDANVQKVLDALNKARSMELQAIHQYMIQHYIVSDMDYGQLAAYIKLISVDEMRHAQSFAERIEALGGKPTCDLAGPIVQPQPIDEVFKFDVGLESNTIATYNELAEVCHKAGDSLSAGLFGSIIKIEDVHLQYYKETAQHISELGKAFLAKYAATSKHTGPVKSFYKVMEKEEF